MDGVTVLSGGVGGAKLALGFYHVLEAEKLTIVANNGDDITLFGLRICPDNDILAYTIAGVVDLDQGWGIKNDNFRAFDKLKALGGEDWFNLGDEDLGLHMFRSGLLAEGVGLAEITRRIGEALGLKCTIIPMCEEEVATRIMTEKGELPLQEYLVKRQADPIVKSIRFDGAKAAKPAPGISEALKQSGLVVIAPSNPLISIAPILAVPGMRKLIADSPALKVGVSPIVGGKSLKGPTDKMMTQLGYQVSPAGVASMFSDILDVFVIDNQDDEYREAIIKMGIRCVSAPITINTLEDKKNLAETLLRICDEEG